jgi:multisubunit Na+/H+ antiporter MnhB subunit
MIPGSLPRRSVILDACVRAEFHTLILLSIYFLFAGHNQPGGGFSGGLVASSAFALRYVAGGERALERSVRIPPPVVLGAGLFLAVATGLVPLVLGGDFLESAYYQTELAVIGQISVSSVLVLDTGVFLVVLGMSLLLLEQFGSADGTDPGPPHHDEDDDEVEVAS